MVSVILPFYNAEETLARAIASVLEQDFQDFELILVDNNSRDKSRAIAENYAEKDARIKILREQNRGVVAAMNKGLEYAKRPWIARMDADDEWKPQKLKRQLAFLKDKPTIKVLGTQVEFASNIPAQGLKSYVEWSNSIISTKQIRCAIFQEMPIVNPSVMFSQNLIEQYGKYKVGDFPEDYEMFLRWHKADVFMAKIPENLMVWHDSDGRLTRTNDAYTPDAFNRIKCKYLATWLQVNNAFYPNIWVWGAGRKTRVKAAELLQYGIEIKGYIDIKENKTSQAPCIHFSQLKPSDNRFVVSFVSNRGKGEEIRAFLIKKGFTEGVNFVMAG